MFVKERGWSGETDILTFRLILYKYIRGITNIQRPLLSDKTIDDTRSTNSISNSFFFSRLNQIKSKITFIGTTRKDVAGWHAATTSAFSPLVPSNVVPDWEKIDSSSMSPDDKSRSEDVSFVGWLRLDIPQKDIQCLSMHENEISLETWKKTLKRNSFGRTNWTEWKVLSTRIPNVESARRGKRIAFLIRTFVVGNALGLLSRVGLWVVETIFANRSQVDFRCSTCFVVCPRCSSNRHPFVNAHWCFVDSDPALLPFPDCLRRTTLVQSPFQICVMWMLKFAAVETAVRVTSWRNCTSFTS